MNKLEYWMEKTETLYEIVNSLDKHIESIEKENKND